MFPWASTRFTSALHSTNLGERRAVTKQKLSLWASAQTPRSSLPGLSRAVQGRVPQGILAEHRGRNGETPTKLFFSLLGPHESSESSAAGLHKMWNSLALSPHTVTSTALRIPSGMDTQKRHESTTCPG